jgi:hypothetical protein
MRDRFSNSAAVCCEETIAKVKGPFVCLCLVLICFGRKAANLFSSSAVERWGTRNIKNTEKRFGVTDWIKKTMICSLHEWIVA